MPVRVLATEGTAADCRQAVELIEGMDAEHLLADKACDTNAILSCCEEPEVIPAVPPKRNRKRPGAQMSISAGTGIWWRTPLCGSSAGVGLPRDAPGMPHRFLPRCRSGVWRSGPAFHDDTI